MERLWLDYQRPAPGRHRAGVLLLMLFIIVDILAGWHYAETTRALEQAEHQVARLKRHGAAELAAGQAGGRSVIAETPALFGGIPAEWDHFFTTLEAAGSDSVTLLSLQPEVTELRLIGEAKDLAGAMDYITRLQSSTLFSEVYLTQSEVLREHPLRPVRFGAVARWKVAT